MALFFIGFMRVHSSTRWWEQKPLKKMDFYYENYDFQGEKQVCWKSCKTALGAKMTTSIWLQHIFMIKSPLSSQKLKKIFWLFITLECSVQCQSFHVYNIPIWPKKVQIFNLISTSRNLKKDTDLQWVYYVAPTKLMTIEYHTDYLKCQRNYQNIQILHSCTVNFISDNSIKFISNKFKNCDQKMQALTVIEDIKSFLYISHYFYQ